MTTPQEPSLPHPDQQPSICRLIPRISADIGAIAKNQRNAQQNFDFRGIDQLLDKLHPILVTHGVYITPDVLERVPDRRDTRQGGTSNVVSLHIRFTLTGPNGDKETCSAWGEGADSGDKATGKAHSMSYKGLALDTPVPTPGGWSDMARIQPGDCVFDLSGQPVRVIGASDVKHLPCYRLTLRNGETFICDEDHLWTARIGQAQLAVHEVETLARARNEGLPVVLPVPAAVVLPDAVLAVDPWVLGYWLGNGASSNARFTAHADDASGVLAATVSAGYQATCVPAKGQGATISVRALGKGLAELGVLGHKHVPPVYLRGSAAQRRALLAGLMDSGGIADKRGRAIFASTDLGLRDAVLELARSLGERPRAGQRIVNGYGKTVQAYTAEWRPRGAAPFALDRKAARVTPRQVLRGISVAKVERVVSVPTRCIAVDSPTHTFLVGRDFVPTHNTAMIQLFCIPVTASSVEDSDRTGEDSIARPADWDPTDWQVGWAHALATSEDREDMTEVYRQLNEAGPKLSGPRFKSLRTQWEARRDALVESGGIVRDPAAGQ